MDHQLEEYATHEMIAIYYAITHTLVGDRLEGLNKMEVIAYELLRSKLRSFHVFRIIPR